ncbi:6791_t:CDS:2, partial [Scutellospora calospora]
LPVKKKDKLLENTISSKLYFVDLPHLGQKLSFEITVGMNGRVWMSSDSIKNISLVYGVLKQAETLNNDECKNLISNL